MEEYTVDSRLQSTPASQLTKIRDDLWPGDELDVCLLGVTHEGAGQGQQGGSDHVSCLVSLRSVRSVDDVECLL